MTNARIIAELHLVLNKTLERATRALRAPHGGTG